MAGHNNDDNKGKEGNKKLGILIGVAIAVVAVIVVFLAVLLKKPEPQEVPSEEQFNAMGEGTVVDPNATETITPAPATESGEGEDAFSNYYFVEMSTTEWRFASSSEASYNAAVSNSDANDCDIYFDVTLDDTGDVVFVSPVITPGNMMVNITLAKELESGTYPATLVYHQLDPETGEEFAKVELVLSIIIE